VVLDGDLGLAVRAEIGELAALSNLGQTARQAVGQGDRQWHQLRCFTAGEADHHSLVAGAEFGLLTACLEGVVHTWAMSADCSLTLTSVPQVR